MKRKKKKPQITQIFKKEIIVVLGLLLLAFILRLIYLSHLKVNDPDFTACDWDKYTYHNLLSNKLLTKDVFSGRMWKMKKRKFNKQRSPQITKNPQIAQIFKKFLTKETIIVLGLLLLAFILRLIYLSHLKVNDPNFVQPANGTDMLTYHIFSYYMECGSLLATAFWTIQSESKELSHSKFCPADRF